MMLTIHGLPVSTKYHDVKTLIKLECRINDFILDNLVNDGDGTKKIRIGLADEGEGSQVMKCLNGYRYSGKILSVQPVGKPPMNTQGNYDSRQNFQPNNDFNQVNNYGNRMDQMGVPAWNVNQQWAPNQPLVNNAPGFNFQQSGPSTFQQQMPTSHPQRSLNQRELMLQARGIQEQGYHGAPGVMQSKTLMPTPVPAKPRVVERSNALRTVEIVDTPNRGQIPGRYPNQAFDQPKPITIMKDNFQGPNQFGREMVTTQGQYPQQAHGQPQPWQQQGQTQPFEKPNQRSEYERKFPQDKPGVINSSQTLERGRDNYKEYEKSRVLSPGRRSPMGRRMSPQSHRMAQDHRMSQHGKMSPPGRRSSPTGRRGSPSDRRISPSRRMVSPDRRISPSRRMSPPGRVLHASGGRVSPSGRRISPPNRMGMSSGRRSPSDRRSPSGRMIQPSGGRVSQISPQERRVSPSGRMVPSGGRVSPSSRRLSPPGRKLSPSGRRLSPSGRMIPPSGRVSPGRRMSPPGRRLSPSGRRLSPSGRMIPPGGRVSPGRRMSPPGRRVSPSGRMIPPGGRVSPGRRMSPPGRRLSPSGRMIQPGVRLSPSGRRMSPPVRMMSPSGKIITPSGGRVSPPGKRISPSGRRISPSGRRMSPSGRRMSPSGRRISPSARRMSPSARRMSPSARRMSPSARRMSPSGRRMSPSGRRMSPSGRRISPSGRRMSPGGRHTLIPSRRESPRRPSPGRQMSPSRRLSSPGARYSPPRRHSDKPDKFGENSRPPVKVVRPAYEPDTKAPNQAMYSGGYRPTGQYPIPGPHQGDRRNSPWQDRDKIYPNQKKEEDRRDRMQMSRGADRGEHGDLQRASPRGSRSPVRRERSPLRDRYRRHSPSPRSPRRSWALEKRRSPTAHEAPPPPIWPGQPDAPDQYPRQNRPNFPDKLAKEEKIKNTPVWETPFVREKHEEPRDRRPNPEFGSEIRIRRDLGAREMGSPPGQEPSPRRCKKHEDRFPPKFEREAPKFEADSFPVVERREVFSKPEPDSKKYLDREAFLERSERHADFDKERLPRRQEQRADAYRKKNENFDKEFDDIYKRAVEFSKKAQELRKHDRKREGRVEESANVNARRDFREEHLRDRQPEDYKKEPGWAGDSKYRIHPDARAKRDKASVEVARRIIQKHLYEIDSTELKNYVEEELKEAAFRLLFELFEDKDVSYIECIIKFNSRFDARDEDRMFYDAKDKFESQFRGVKRSAPDASEIPSKSSRGTADHNLKLDNQNSSASNITNAITDWKANFGAEVSAQYVDVPPPVLMVNLPFDRSGFVQQYEPVPQEQMYQQPMASTFSDYFDQTQLPVENDGAYHMYLCKDDFSAYQELEINALKEFLVSEIFGATASSDHAPNFTFKGLQTPFRYELVTEDPVSRDWLMNLDFSDFVLFKVTVYMNEELWYERVAIWLPGHSKCRKIEPLTKLKLQNQHLKELNLGKWKFVKKIVTMKGTRLYVDLPPSSARSLEHVKTLSYELQQVNFFLRALAVDKNAFDAGLVEASITDPSFLISAVQSSPMPTLKQNPDTDMVLITLKSKCLSVDAARKIKESIIYMLFKYLKAGGKSKTDFVKYGYIAPCYFGIVPANNQSKKWLLGLELGKLNKQPIIIIDSNDKSEKSTFFDMTVVIRHRCMHISSIQCMQYLIQNLKQSNMGVKGINFDLWKTLRIGNRSGGKHHLHLQIDVESANALANMNFALDYLEVESGPEVRSVKFEPRKCSLAKLKEKITKCMAEQSDSHVVADMEIASSDSGDDNDIICLGDVSDNSNDGKSD